MRKLIILLLLLPFLDGYAQGNLKNPTEEYHERMQWFDDAKLGIFIHWGIYAVDGISESWSFYNGYISHEDYMKQLNGFTAKKYNPEYWADLISKSGAKYAVITSKHHDGVALFNTKFDHYNTTDNTPAKADVIDPFVKELRKKDVKVGLYYSLIDWSYPDYPAFTRIEKRYTDDPKRWEEFCELNLGQIKEISKQYNPDLIWFDGDWEHSAEEWKSTEIVDILRKKNPNIIINSRLQGHGDYATPEQGLPVVRPLDRYWELCMTMNDSWGYQRHDNNYKSANQIIRIFIDCIEKGGNLLLDIGPKADGTIPKEQVEILEELGRWNKKHYAAVFESIAGIDKCHYYGATTLSNDKTILYLFVDNKPNGPIVVRGLKNKVNRAWVLGEGTILDTQVVGKQYWSQIPGILYIDVPEDVLDEQVTVIAVLLDGPVDLYTGEVKAIESN
jgi:alpha-L-fucosidase